MNELQLRDLHLEDQACYWKLACIAFHSKNAGLEDEKAFLESCAREEKKAKENPTTLGNTVTRTGIFQGERLLSALTAHAFEVHFDGNICEFCGIGGVMSDPSARRNGGVSRLLRDALQKAKEHGQIFSHLYPFQTSFYRKFGYAHCAYGQRWTIPVQYLPEIPYQIRWYENSSAEQQAVKEIYETFAKGYNLSFCRSENRWNSLFSKCKPYSGSSFSYLHEGKHGPDGFLSYRTQTSDDKPMTILVDHLYFTNPAALREMLAFLGSQRSYASEVQLPLPLDVDISFWLKEVCAAYDKCNVRRETVHMGASRVVDAESVLKLARYHGKGTASICIDDPVCPWNNRTFRVEFDETCLSVTETQTWDIRLGIDAFTALILGSRDLTDTAYMDGVEIRENLENLQKIFYRKNLWIDDTF